MHTTLWEPFERTLVQTCTSKIRCQHMKQWYMLSLAYERVICVWLSFFLVDPGGAGHRTAASQTILAKWFRKSCLGCAKSNTLKLCCATFQHRKLIYQMEKYKGCMLEGRTSYFLGR